MVIERVCELIFELVQRPAELKLWFKFDMQTHMNAADQTTWVHLVIKEGGSVNRLPKEHGMYRNWGVKVDGKAAIEMP
jgi:hypothetical protein